MSNPTNYDFNVQQTDTTAYELVSSVTSKTPAILLVVAILSLVGAAVFHFFYFESELIAYFVSIEKASVMGTVMAVFAALMVPVTRFSLLAATARDFGDKKQGNGWGGIFMSLGLMVFDLWLMARGHTGMANIIGLFFVSVSFLLEIRIVMTSEKLKFGKPASTSGRRQRQRQSNGAGLFAN